MNADYMVKHTDRNIVISPFFNSNYFYGLEKELTSPIFQTYVKPTDLSLLELSAIYDYKGRAAFPLHPDPGLFDPLNHRRACLSPVCRPLKDNPGAKP